MILQIARGTVQKGYDSSVLKPDDEDPDQPEQKTKGSKQTKKGDKETKIPRHLRIPRYIGIPMNVELVSKVVVQKFTQCKNGCMICMYSLCLAAPLQGFQSFRQAVLVSD